ncbi:MAG: M23 family metallopeptidase [Bacteroides sp.]|nr:M23 family metallopeptidase [Bacteroides sp.]MCM1095337.1 M23 family metallopeptidase [Terasakiella sp.]
MQAFYRYNQATERYERVFPSRRRRVWVTLWQFVWGALAGAAVVVALYYVIDFPKERQLRRHNDALAESLEELGHRTDRALAVMEDIAARDNNFYRVVMQAEPLGAAARYAGLERRRVDSLPDDALVRAVATDIDRLDNMIYHQSRSFDFLRARAMESKDRIAHIPAIQPVSEKSLRQMASGYGYRRDPIYGTAKFHEGMDFSAAPGTPVYATGRGRVISAGWNSGYGNLIEIDHGYGYVTRYAHLSKIGVSAGQTVSRGDLIGEVGNTGKSTGPHLHYEVRLHGAPQNPVNYYFMDLSPAEYDAMIHQAENAGRVMD